MGKPRDLTDDELTIALALAKEGVCQDCGGSVHDMVDAAAHARGDACIDKSEREEARRMACAAANLAQLAACYREEAQRLAREAEKMRPDDVDWSLDPDVALEWSVDPDGHSPRGLPDDWMGIGDQWLKEQEAL